MCSVVDMRRCLWRRLHGPRALPNALVAGFITSFFVRSGATSPISTLTLEGSDESSVCGSNGKSCSLSLESEASGDRFMQQMTSSLEQLHEWGTDGAVAAVFSDIKLESVPLTLSLAGASPRRAPSPAPPPEMSLLANAPQPHLVKAETASKTEAAAATALGDLHFTQHGCHCLLDWEYEGEKQEGCSITEPAFAKGHHWCKVNTPCQKNQGLLEGPDGEKAEWDYCSLPGEILHEQTTHGCHCAPHWSYNDTEYSGCSRTSLGAMWCYIFETDDMCKEALRTEHGGQHWDYCFVQDQTSPYLTQHGCHCLPEWTHNGEKQMGCANVEMKPGEPPQPWCITLEDSVECPMGKPQVEGQSVLTEDTCSLQQGQEDKILKTLTTAGDDRCHCQPVWEHAGKEYMNCASTPDRTRGWCYLLEDNRACPIADGKGEGKEETQRWRYCEALPGAEKQEDGNEPQDAPDSNEQVQGKDKQVEDSKNSAGPGEGAEAEGNGAEAEGQGTKVEGEEAPTSSEQDKGRGKPVPEENTTNGGNQTEQDAIAISAPFTLTMPYSKNWKEGLAKRMAETLRSMGISKKDLDTSRVTLANADGNIIEIGDRLEERMFPLRVAYDSQRAFRFLLKYSEGWKENLAKSMQQALEALGMAEEDLDPTRVLLSDAKGKSIAVGDQVSESHFPLSVDYSEAVKESASNTEAPEKSGAARYGGLLTSAILLVLASRACSPQAFPAGL